MEKIGAATTSTSKQQLDDGEEETKTTYTWEGAYEKTWEALHEDEQGTIESSVVDLIHKAKRQRLADRQRHTKLGIMRHVILIIDVSDAMLIKDMPPNRHSAVCDVLSTFIADFFDYNPISQLGIVTTQNKRAKVVLELSGNVQQHSDAIRELRGMKCVGEASVQNALEVAISRLKQVPAHSSREILMIMGSLSTCDPGDVHATVAKCVEARIKVNVIALAAQVHLLKYIAYQTSGSNMVIVDTPHMRELLFAITLPPPVKEDATFSLVRMGFPLHRRTKRGDSLSMCMCHAPAPIDLPDANYTFTEAGYFCPQCNAKYCSLPQQCRLCKLTLVSAPQLARSYQHLAPLAAFKEQPLGADDVVQCDGCMHKIERAAYACMKCDRRYCIECDLLLHESLHVCPGCC